jgi:thiamine kinase-like enzyme
MVHALPPNIQLKLQQTLSQWPHWRCSPALTRTPKVLEVLSAGVSNFSVLVESQQYFVVRIDGLSPASNGLNRQTEWRALEAANKAGLAPHPCYFNPDLGSLVCCYLAPENAPDSDISDVAQLLRAIHQLPARHHRLDLAERILRYEKQIEHRGQALNDALIESQAKLAGMLLEVSRQTENTVLCHNDLLHANRIYSGGKLWALDWEYCAMGNPWYDIAVVVNGDSLSERETETLTTAYLGRAPDILERGLLYRYGCIYRYLEVLWYLALEKPVLTAEAIDAKSNALRSMLAKGSG